MQGLGDESEPVKEASKSQDITVISLPHTCWSDFMMSITNLPGSLSD